MMQRAAHTLALLVLASLALGTSAEAETFGGPFGLEKAGWTLVTASDDTYVFMKSAARGVGAVRRVWTAYDSEKVLQRGGFNFRSVESLGEFDCQRRLSRVVQEIFHDQAGLMGRSWAGSDPLPTPWRAPEPDSVGAIRMAFACRALSDT